MTKYSSYQRMMLHDSAKTARSAANSEASLQALAQAASSQQYASAEMLRVQRQIASAEAANNRVQLDRLRVEQENLRVQLQENSRRQAEEEKRDRQAFAMWRQTPDGKAFVDWFGPAKAQVDEIVANDEAWRNEVAAVKEEWKAAHREKVAFATHDPTEDNNKVAKGLFIAAGVCAALWIISLGAGVVGLVNGLFILGALGFTGAGIWRRISSDLTERRAAHSELSAKGLAELGFDPLSPDAPAWAEGDVLAYAREVESFYLAAVTEHPSASLLPKLIGYRFVAPSTLTCERLRNFLPA